MSDTVVFQSFRAHDVPAWMARCIASVQMWARIRGYDYRFVGDELFDLLPESYRTRTGHAPQLLADLGRLMLARDLLAHGYRRAVWLDADILIFAPEQFVLPRERSFYVCRELWVERVGSAVETSERLNNCACVFDVGTSFLPFYIDACQQLVHETAGALSPLSVGTSFLTALDRVLRLPRLENVGLLSPDVLRDIANGGGSALTQMRKGASARIDAANLCGSFRGKTMHPKDAPSWVVSDELFDRAVEALLAARGLP